MQEPPSLSQLLRESYLAGVGAQKCSEMNPSDASPSCLQIYESLKSKVEDSSSHTEPKFTDLSAFLSQEELDKSVNLACQAIRHGAQEERADVKASVASVTPLNISTLLDSSCELPSVSLVSHALSTSAASATVPFTQLAPEYEDLPRMHESFPSDGKVLQVSTRQDNIISDNRDSGDGFGNFNRPMSNAPYGLETQSKKEFLNKAADFIEELSSLFKANSSKRVRPRSCKTYRSKNQSKSKNDQTLLPLSHENRERAVMPAELKKERLSHQPKLQLDSKIGHKEFEDCGMEQSKGDTFSKEVDLEADSLALTETPHPAAPVSEPPFFIQKLKSREVPEGSKVQLDCVVTGLPAPEVRWFCEGKELENSPDIQIITNGNLHSMIIAEAFEEDTGRYSCFASNFYGTDSTSAEIYVEGASSSDSEGEQHFGQVAQQRKSLPTTSSQTLPVDEGSLSSHPAAATDRPSEQLSSSTITQIIAEPPLTAQTTATIPVLEPAKTLLVSRILPPLEETTVLPVQLFPTLLPSDKELSRAQEFPAATSAIFTSPQVPTTTVKATPRPLNPVVSSALPVLSAPPQMSQNESQTSKNHCLKEVDGQPTTAAPVFTKGLQELLASEGQLVVLECRVKAQPSPQVDWYREGKIIEDSPDFRILQKKPRSLSDSEEICTLVIAEVFPEDSGMFTCVASNKYGTIESTTALNVAASGINSNHVRPFSSLSAESSQIQGQEHSPPTPTAKPQPVNVSSSIKPLSRTTLTDTLRLEPFNNCKFSLDPNSTHVLSADPLCTSLPSVDPTGLNSSSCLNSGNTCSTNLDPKHFHLGPPGCSRADPDPERSCQVPFHQRLISYPCAVGTSAEQEVSKSSVISNTSPKIKANTNYQSTTSAVLPLPDPPPNSCLKTGSLTNNKESRSGSRVGLRVHFKLPEEEQGEVSCGSDEDNSKTLVGKEPPPVLTKPKLDQAQLLILHNQVLMEQQQETEHQTQTHSQPQTQPLPQVRTKPDIQNFTESLPHSPTIHHETQVRSFQPYLKTLCPDLTPLEQKSTTSSAPSLSSGPSLKNTTSKIESISPSSPFSPPLLTPELKTFSFVSPPPPASQMEPPPVHRSQMNTTRTSNLNLSPAALAVSSTPQCFSPPPLKLSTVSSDSTSYSEKSPFSAFLVRTHASLTDLTASSHTFNYTRPKEFISAQTFSPVRSPSPTESPVPLLQELAAELNSSAASSPTLPPFSPPPGIAPLRVLRSPTSPASLMSSPPPGSSSYFNSMFSVTAQLQPKASSPTSSSSTPSPIQNPVAFLSSVLPSLTPSQPTNSMGLPRGAPSGLQKQVPKMRLLSSEDIRDSKEVVLHNIEKKPQSFQSFKDDAPNLSHQQKLNYEEKTGSRLLGPNIPATVINFDEEYKVSNFEQRLMSEIEFRLERTPVQESDDEVQHDDVPTGKCIAPIFEKKLKNFKAMEGVPVTFSCKVVGIPVPKIYWFKDGVQILRNNVHYKKIREGDGTCALHIESTTNDDDGNYTVMAANPQGRISCSGHLIVQTGPPRNRMTPIHPQRVRSRIQEVESEQTKERFSQPYFLQAPGDMLAQEGGLCRLDCKVSGLPTPELMWLVNGRPLYPDLYHKMLVRENGIHSLVIDPLMQSDNGIYTCIASSKAGQSSFSLELKVVEKEMKHPPKFVEKLQNIGIPEGSPVRLECRVVGMPPPVIFWKKDNETISKPKDRLTLCQDATGYVCLLIQPTTKDDAGWYTVSAKNEAGIISCTCRLDIYAQWHQIVPALIKKSPSTGSRYAALTGLSIDIKSAFPASETSPTLLSSSPPEATWESEEL